MASTILSARYHAQPATRYVQCNKYKRIVNIGGCIYKPPDPSRLWHIDVLTSVGS
jgi:hypothetical protein